jgi:hypothetical protein
MFVIACKFNIKNPIIYDLVDDIRTYHKTEKIVIIDSDSDDKSYFELTNKYVNVEILDVKNKYYHVGAYWLAYKTYPDEEFYYFMHDSMRVKANLDYIKEKDFTAFAYFDFNNPDNENIAKNEILKHTPYHVPNSGQAIQGPCFFVKNKLMKILKSKGVDKILPTYSEHSDVKIGVAAYALEGAYGIFFSQEGYNIIDNSLIGSYISHGYPQFIENYDSSWMYPVQKILLKRK